MASIESVNVIIGAKDNASGIFSRVQNNAATSFGKISSVAAGAGKALLGIGTIAGGALAIGAGKAVTSFAGFETLMTNVGSVVDTSKESIAEMSKELLTMSKEVPVGAEELAESLYDIRSAGIEAAGAMTTLKSAAILGKTGLGTTQEATDLLTSSINAFGLDAKDSDKIANILFETVQKGKNTIGELSQAFGAVAPIANAAGLSFEEFQAATAAITLSGMPASQAQNSLKAALSNVIKPSSDVTKLAKKLGIEFNTTALKAKGLKVFLDDVKEATGGDIEVMGKLFGSMEGLASILTLTGAGNEAFVSTLDTLTDGVDSMADKFDDKTDTIAVKWQLMKNVLNANLIESGGAMSESVSSFLDFASENLPAVLETLGGAFSSAIDGAKEFIEPIQDFFVDNKVAIIGYFNTFKETAIEAYDIVSGLGKDLFSGMSNIIISNKDSIVGAFDSLVTTTKSVFGVIQGVVKVFKDAWDRDFLGITTSLKTNFTILKFFGLGVADVLGGIVDTVSILFNNWEFYWSKMKLTVFDATNDMIGNIESFINKAITAFNAVSGVIGFEGMSQVSLGKIDTSLLEAKVGVLAPEQTIGEAWEDRFDSINDSAKIFAEELVAINNDSKQREEEKATRETEILEQYKQMQQTNNVNTEIIINAELKDDATIDALYDKFKDNQRNDLASLGVDLS